MLDPIELARWSGRVPLRRLIRIESVCPLPFSGHVQLENARDHDDRLRLIAVLEQCELQRLGAIDE